MPAWRVSLPQLITSCVSGKRGDVELHDVRAGLYAFDVVLAVEIGDDVRAVFEQNAHARQPLRMPVSAIAVDHLADEDGFRRKQVFAHRDRGRRGIGAADARRR